MNEHQLKLRKAKGDLKVAIQYLRQLLKESKNK